MVLTLLFFFVCSRACRIVGAVRFSRTPVRLSVCMYVCLSVYLSVVRPVLLRFSPCVVVMVRRPRKDRPKRG